MCDECRQYVPRETPGESPKVASSETLPNLDTPRCPVCNRPKAARLASECIGDHYQATIEALTAENERLKTSVQQLQSEVLRLRENHIRRPDRPAKVCLCFTRTEDNCPVHGNE